MRKGLKRNDKMTFSKNIFVADILESPQAEFVFVRISSKFAQLSEEKQKQNFQRPVACTIKVCNRNLRL